MSDWGHDYWCSSCLEPGAFWLDGRMYCDPCWDEAYEMKKLKEVEADGRNG